MIKGTFLGLSGTIFSAENDGGNSPGHSLWELLVDRQRRKINGDIKPAHVWLQTNQSGRDVAGFMFGHVRACASIIFTFWKSAILTQQCSLLSIEYYLSSFCFLFENCKVRLFWCSFDTKYKYLDKFNLRALFFLKQTNRLGNHGLISWLPLVPHNKNKMSVTSKWP